ncbi:hypothetical protein LDENG_00047120 [Lucifuga dentata]|nr:hypothetical protein LDENG_00047120 [Lucifuga dentata]
MTNVSGVTSVHLSAYYGMEDLKPMYFCIFLFVFIAIIAENALLIGLIYHDKALHEPMYFLLCNLAVNSLYGSTALLPALLTNVLSHSYDMSLSFCQTQIYAVHTYAMTEFTILAAMSYDRYVAICYPLQYHTVMSQKVCKLIIFTWLYPLIAFLMFFIPTLCLRFCQRIIENFYCVNYLLVRLSCTDTSLFNIVGIVFVGLYTMPQIIMIFYTYVQILRICMSSFNASKLKALRTCIPHLIAIVNYSIGCFLEIAQSRLKLSYLPYNTKMFLSLYFLIFPPLLNPVIYGLSIQTIRVRLLRIFQRKNRQTHIK